MTRVVNLIKERLYVNQEHYAFLVKITLLKNNETAKLQNIC